jgi:hypothetical protein
MSRGRTISIWSEQLSIATEASLGAEPCWRSHFIGAMTDELLWLDRDEVTDGALAVQRTLPRFQS